MTAKILNLINNFFYKRRAEKNAALLDRLHNGTYTSLDIKKHAENRSVSK